MLHQWKFSVLSFQVAFGRFWLAKGNSLQCEALTKLVCSALCAKGRQWPPVAASGREEALVGASGCQWGSVETGRGQWPPVGASGGQWPSVGVSGCQ